MVGARAPGVCRLTRTKRRKMAFFEGCPVGWGGGTHRSWPGGRTPQGILQVRVRNDKNTTHCEFCSVYQLPSPESKPLDPPRALAPPSQPFPDPQQHEANRDVTKSTLQLSKNNARNLLRPWGPCPYHLPPPRNRSPWTPPEPLPRQANPSPTFEK